MILMSYGEFCILLTLVMIVGIVMSFLAILLGELAIDIGKHVGWMLFRKRKKYEKGVTENGKSNDPDVRSEAVHQQRRK